MSLINLRLINLRLLIYVLLFVPLALFGQKSKTQLEKERKENEVKIIETEKILTETKKVRSATLGQLTALNNQINSRESLIKSIDSELILIDLEIEELSVIMEDIDLYLKSLKEEYAKMVYKSSKSRHGFHFLTFLFASDSFTQLYRRIKYMEQYAEARRLQSKQITETLKELNDQQREQEKRRSQQKKLRKSQVVESQTLILLKQEKNQLISKLTEKEGNLKKEMDARKLSIKRLDKVIADLIKNEIDREKKESANQQATTSKITGKFSDQLNRLRWPVKSGFISSKFGIQKDLILKNVTLDNTGIDIQTKSNEEVVVVFEGEVRIKAFVPGQNNVVIVKHGNYYTVYSKLKTVSVKQGQFLKAGEVIGQVYTNSAGISEMHFEVWLDKKKLDPEKWLAD
jgi:murein hydrolase activator